MEYENKFVGLSSVMSHDLEILRYELEYGWKLALIPMMCGTTNYF